MVDGILGILKNFFAPNANPSLRGDVIDGLALRNDFDRNIKTVSQLLAEQTPEMRAPRRVPTQPEIQQSEAQTSAQFRDYSKPENNPFVALYSGFRPEPRPSLPEFTRTIRSMAA